MTETAKATMPDESVLTSTQDTPPQALRSGRSITLRTDEQQDTVEIRSPQGDVELTIVLTDAGPVVSLKGAKLEMEAVDTLSMSCRRLDVKSKERATIYSDEDIVLASRETKLRSSDDITLNGAHIRMNSP
ncbi:hypothetical protein Pan216_26850 [Planctomycetes bacterium Pan216]|uniref:DUF2345 domain-containing protein n=1 Tax=Kolteria novifilia TaxID=2527975 RepID=A0A518B4A8_9BACT|nr:hypothetical protein Pan216_26850 [Planctomycetes bacterium Pan216]